MLTHSPPQGRRLAAVMFTDMVGYSALTRANEAQAIRLLDEHFRLVRSVVPGYRGREIKTIGDSVLISFDSALAALDCAIAVQQRHAARNQAMAPAKRFEIRIGIHLGDVEHRGGDVFGDGVNIAARVQTLAPHGGLAVSAHVHAQVHSELARLFRPLGPQTLKNIPTPIEVFVLDAEALPEAETELPAAGAGVAALLQRRGRRWNVIMGALTVAVLGALALGLPPLLRQSQDGGGLLRPAGSTAATRVIEMKVGLLEALEIAQKDVHDGVAYHVELEGSKYSVDFARGAESVNLVIDATDGTVVEKLVEDDEDHSADVQMSQITLHEAVAAALKKATGVPVEVEIRLLPGRAVVEVKLISDNEPVLVEVDGVTREASVITMVRH
ncbi:MAG: adenylate/guanylate cyclase domain-containing protein [Nevskiales bacterium]